MLKWCIIGSGDVVERLVGNSLNIKNNSKIISILSDNTDQARKVANKIDVKEIYLNTSKNIKKIQNDKNINSIYIATPPNYHFYYIQKFCRFKKNIVCEKPLVRNNKEIVKIKKLRIRYKFNLLTCFYRRYLNRFIYIKKLLDKNFIGKIVFFETRYFHNHKNHPTANIKNKIIPWRFKKEISGGGNIMDMGIHSLDLIDYLIGEIESANSFNNNFKKNFNVEDTTVINLKLKNGIIGQGSWCSISPVKEDYFKIYGLKGNIKFSTNYSEDNFLYIYKNNKIKKIKLTYDLPLHKNMMKNFINLLIKNNKIRKYTFAKNGIKTMEILNKIIKL